MGFLTEYIGYNLSCTEFRCESSLDIIGQLVRYFSTYIEC